MAFIFRYTLILTYSLMVIFMSVRSSPDVHKAALKKINEQVNLTYIRYI